MRLPFDIVFLINRFVEAVSQAITDAAGQPNQFIGDGVLALFGLDTDPATACRQALRAASLVASNVADLNHQFATEVREPIEYGIGIHAGQVIIGDIGFRDRTVFTALGDSVNVAARLQDMTKSLNCKVVVSEDVYTTAGMPADALSRTNIEISRTQRADDRANRGGPDGICKPTRPAKGAHDHGSPLRYLQHGPGSRTRSQLSSSW